jgi:enoyl-CoA hydratase/carnithine racemase
MLSVHQQCNVAILTINRPERRNALSAAIIDALYESLRRLDDDPEVKAIVLDGAPPGFCSGSDVRELSRLDIRSAVGHEAATAGFARNIAKITKPVVAAVSGFAFGGGLFLAASCDVVVTSGSTRWGLPEVRLGWLPPWGFAALIRRVGVATARRLAMTGEEITGTEAHRIGLADRLVGDDGSGITRAALSEGWALAQLPAESVRATKRFFGEHLIGEAEALDQAAGLAFEENLKSDAAIKGLRRFADPNV